MTLEEFNLYMDNVVNDLDYEREYYCCRAFALDLDMKGLYWKSKYLPIVIEFNKLIGNPPRVDMGYHAFFGDPWIEGNKEKRLKALEDFRQYAIDSKLYENWEK